MKVAILGAGKLGLKVTEALLDGDYDITLVDTDEDKLNQIAQQLDVLTVVGDAKTVEVLKEIDIESIDFLFACTTTDDSNIIAASIAKKLGCKKVAARVREPEHMNQIDFICEKFNIDMLVNPDNLITSEIYRYLTEKYSLSTGIFSLNKLSLIEFEAYKIPDLVDKSLVDFRTVLPNAIVVGISRNGKMIVPHGNDVIEHDDLLYIMSTKTEIKELSKRVHGKRQKTDVRRVMIIGGGKTGFYLAQRLSEYGVSVKLIEKDKKRCHYLSDKLKNVMVLHGDGGDMTLLEEEDFDQMDAFVTATGFDEENLLLALTAKQHGIEDVISKISHEIYTELISKMDIDMVLNPLDLCASSILRTIREKRRVISSVLLQGQAELMEIYASESMHITGTALKDIELPDYIIIAAIHRGSKTIIPDGTTKIASGDRVVLVCLLSHIGFVEKLFKHSSILGKIK